MNCPSIQIDVGDKIPRKLLSIVGLLENELGEIGRIIAEDDCTISVEVYRDSYEDASKTIKSRNGKIYLKLVEKFDDPFYTVVYKKIKRRKDNKNKYTKKSKEGKMIKTSTHKN